MADFVLSCCSTADLTKEHFQQRDISYICFHYALDGVDYPDDLGETMPFDKFYAAMANGAETRTSQVNISEFVDYFTPFLEQGKDILHVCLSSGLSGVSNSAENAARIVRERYPDRKIYIVDSLGASSGYGLLKSYCNVNEVISGIMLNWIVLYLTNMLLTTVKEDASPYTKVLAHINESAVLPSLGLGALFNNNQYVGLAIPLSVLMAILVWVVLEKTKFGYELKATGYNKNAAKYCGMAEKRNVILSLMISGALAGMGAAMLYLTGYEQWQCSTSSVPAMGFNGIAAAFLGGLNPIGTVLASFFIQHITAGGAYVDKSMYCAQISDLISALIIYLCGFVLFMKHAMNSYAAKREEKAALKARAAEAQARAEAGKGGDQ